MGHIYRVSASVVSAATWIPSHSASFWSLVASQAETTKYSTS